MRFDRVLAVDNNGIVAALIEHSEVYAEDGRIIHAARHCALVGSHDHDIVVSERDIGICTDESLQHLICGAHVVKSRQGDRVLDTGIVCIESDYVGHAHVDKLLKSHCAVERFSRCTSVLSSFIKHGHYN